MRGRSPRLPLLLSLTLVACSPGASEPGAPEPLGEAIAALSATQQAKLLAADGQLADAFGNAVAIDGDTAIVGAYQNGAAGVNAGAAYVFVRSGAQWSQQAKLLASDAAPGDAFGISVALSGDTALVGAYGKANGGPLGGAAYVFVRSGGQWSQQAKIIPVDNVSTDAFGISSALEGDTAVIGAMWKNQTRGAAYVFVRSGGQWSQQAKLVAADGQPNDQLGNEVAISGNLALVSAFQAGPKAQSSGAVYAFQRQGDVWTFDGKLFPADGAAIDFFGYGLALSGTSALIGAPNNDQAGSDAGAVYAFERVNGSWTEQAKLIAGNAGNFDNFGRSISMNAGTAVVGSPIVQSLTGRATLFTRAGGVWSQGPTMIALDGVSDDRFGEHVALSGTSALIGAFGNDQKATNAGAAYVFALDGVDGSACVAAADCASGFCEGAICCPIACAPAAECHEAGVCAPAAGACTYANSPDGTACVGGMCMGGACVSSSTSTGTGGGGGSGNGAGGTTAATGGSTASTGGSSGTGGSTAGTGASGGSGASGSGGAAATGASTGGGGATGVDSGCGCRSAGSEGRGGAALLLTALALGGLHRRRSPANRCARAASR